MLKWQIIRERKEVVLLNLFEMVAKMLLLGAPEEDFIELDENTSSEEISIYHEMLDSALRLNEIQPLNLSEDEMSLANDAVDILNRMI